MKYLIVFGLILSLGFGTSQSASAQGPINLVTGNTCPVGQSIMEFSNSTTCTYTVSIAFEWYAMGAVFNFPFQIPANGYWTMCYDETQVGFQSADVSQGSGPAVTLPAPFNSSSSAFVPQGGCNGNDLVHWGGKTTFPFGAPETVGGMSILQ